MIVNKTFLEIMSPLGVSNRRSQSSRSCRRCSNECRTKKDKLGNPLTLKNPWETSCRPPGQMWSSHSQSLWRTYLSRKIKKSSACRKKTILLWIHDRINMEDGPKILIENRKCIFWQTSINDQKTKLRV